MRIVAVGLVAHGAPPDGEPTYLVQRRSQGTHLPGLWELPGGKVEPGEAPHRALERELAEELGITVEPPVPLVFSWHDYGDRQVLVLVYETRTRPDSPPPRPFAAEAVLALPAGEILALEMPPANAPLREILASRARVSESG
jgi:8-oxo-dGTP diphosphatase